MATIFGGSGPDVLDGTAADDTLFGFDGDDTLRASLGADRFDGGAGFDFVDFSPLFAAVTARLDGAPNARAAAGTSIVAAEGLIGTLFDDVLVGSAGVNVLLGGAGADALFGLDGDDLLDGGAGADTIRGGGGFDRVSYAAATAGVGARLDGGMNFGAAAGDVLIGVEGLIGSVFDDTLVGSAGADVLRGGAGDDRLFGHGGADTIDGGAGVDTVSYANVTSAGVGARLDGGASFGAAAGDVLIGVESLIGTAFDDALVGSDGANTLQGGAGNDRLFGMGGDDLLFGGGGEDTIDGGAGVDTVSYAAAPGAVGARLDGGVNFGVAAENVLTAVEGLIGSAFNDALVGSDGPNLLQGGPGDDRLFGMGGPDTLNGGAGEDVARFDNLSAPVRLRLNDGAHGGAAAGVTLLGIEALTGTRFADTLVGAAGGERLDGGPGDDLIFGLDGADTLIGGGGRDALTGGAGPDVFLFDRSLGAADVSVIRDFTPADGDLIAAPGAMSITPTDAPGGALLTIAQPDGGVARALVAGRSAAELAGVFDRYGGPGDDVMASGAGVSGLHGLGGADTLTGGAGSVRMFGGPGADVFVIRTPSATDPADQIMDFGVGDEIAVAALLAGRSYADVAGVLRVERVAGGNDMALILRAFGGQPERRLALLRDVDDSLFADAAANPSRFLTRITDAERSVHGGFGDSGGLSDEFNTFYSFVNGVALTSDGSAAVYAGGIFDIRRTLYSDVLFDIGPRAGLEAQFPDLPASVIDAMVAALLADLENNDFVVAGLEDDASDLDDLRIIDVKGGGDQRAVLDDGALGILGNNFSEATLAITDDERFVVVASPAGGFFGDAARAVTLVDLGTPTPTVANLTTSTQRGEGLFALSPSGSAIVYADDDAGNDLRLRDLATGATAAILDGTAAEGQAVGARWLAISNDGRTVGFSTALALSADDGDSLYDLYGVDLDDGTVFLISRGVEDAGVFSALPGATMDDELILAEVGDGFRGFDVEAARAGATQSLTLDLAAFDGLADFRAASARAAAGGAVVGLIGFDNASFFDDLHVLDLRTGRATQPNIFFEAGSEAVGLRSDFALSADGSSVAIVERFEEEFDSEVLSTGPVTFDGPVGDIADIAALAPRMPGFVDGVSTVTGTIEAESDVDWWRLPVGGDARGLVVDVSGAPGGGGTLPDPLFEVHRGRGDPAQTRIARNDDGGVAGDARALVDGGGTAAEALYLRVDAFRSADRDDVGTYTVTVREQRRPGDSVETAAVLGRLATRLESLNGDDVHWYAFADPFFSSFEARFSITPTEDLLGDALQSPVLTLHDASGAALATATPDAAGDLSFGVRDAGQYFLSVAAGDDPSGGYALMLS